MAPPPFDSPLSTLRRSLSLLSLLSLLLITLSSFTSPAASHFEGFGADDEDEWFGSMRSSHLRSPPLTRSQSHPPPPAPLTRYESHPPPPAPWTDPKPILDPDLPSPSQCRPKPYSANFDFWDEDEFGGLPFVEQLADSFEVTQDAAGRSHPTPDLKTASKYKRTSRSYTVEIACVSFLLMFGINFFTGKWENENIARAWSGEFSTNDSIFKKNFRLLGVGKGPLIKEGQNVIKFYARGPTFCQGLSVTMELKSRHNLISRMYNLIVPCHDEITFEVSMNDDAMDRVIFAMARKKAAKTMQKEVWDLRSARLLSPPGRRKWLADELAVITESKEVAEDMITNKVLEVLGDKGFEKFGNGFIYMHFSDQHLNAPKKKLIFKFALPDANDMAELTHLVDLIPYFVNQVGQYKLGSQENKRRLEEIDENYAVPFKKEDKERARQKKKPRK